MCLCVCVWCLVLQRSNAAATSPASVFRSLHLSVFAEYLHIYLPTYLSVSISVLPVTPGPVAIVVNLVSPDSLLCHVADGVWRSSDRHVKAVYQLYQLHQLHQVHQIHLSALAFCTYLCLLGSVECL